jgi:hypothetical protein
VKLTPPASTEAKKMWIYTSTPSYIIMPWCLIIVQQTDNFTLPGALTVGVKRPRREAYQSLPSTAEVKNDGAMSYGSA